MWCDVMWCDGMWWDVRCKAAEMKKIGKVGVSSVDCELWDWIGELGSRELGNWGIREKGRGGGEGQGIGELESWGVGLLGLWGRGRYDGWTMEGGGMSWGDGEMIWGDYIRTWRWDDTRRSGDTETRSYELKMRSIPYPGKTSVSGVITKVQAGRRPKLPGHGFRWGDWWGDVWGDDVSRVMRVSRWMCLNILCVISYVLWIWYIRVIGGGNGMRRWGDDI